MYRKIIILSLLFISAMLHASPIQIVAAENFYGDIAKQIGGKYVVVTNILSNPNQDPHLFTSNPSTAKAVANANLIVYNGINYDVWMENLIKTNNHLTAKIIVVSKLIGKKSGDNPHIWYDPATMLAYAQQLTSVLNTIDTSHSHYYQQQLSRFKRDYLFLDNRILQLKQQYHGIPVIATEPVFDYMTSILGLTVYGKDFQLNIMNETEPSANQISDFEEKLNHHAVNVLIYNNQVTNPLTEMLKNLAKKSSIPVVGVNETKPLNQNYWDWLNNELTTLKKALDKKDQ